MSDWLFLGVLAIAFYFYECCTWTPATAFACFRKPFRRSWAAAGGAELVGNESGGFAFSDPLTLSGNIIQCSRWPIAVSPDGVCLDAADAATFWPFESLQSITSYEKTVRFNGEAVFKTASETLARALARHLEELREMPHRKRAAAIRSALGDSFDAELLESTWSRFGRAARALRVLASFPLIWLVVIAPVVFVLFGPLATWPYLLGGLFLTSFAVSMEFVRVHKAELPGASDRWLHAVSMTLFPIAAIRAVDRVSKERVADFHPCAVTGMLCSDADGDPILRRLGFDLRRPLPDHDNADILKCREWYHAEQRAAFKKLLKSLGRDPFAAPEPLDEAMIAYCPRCHGQFGDGAECSDCDDVTLMRFGEAEITERGKQRQRA